MPRNGSGTFAYAVGYPFTTGTVISSTDMNSVLLDIANNLTSSIAKDGQTTATADIPMGGFKFTSVGDAALRTQFPSVGQIQDGGLIKIGAVAGTNTITGSVTPSIGSSGYVSGQLFTIVPAATNTGAATLALNSLAAKNILRQGAALVAGDMIIGVPYLLYYDGTQFNLISAPMLASEITGSHALPDGVLSTNVPLLNAPNTWVTNNSFTGAIANGTLNASLRCDSAAPGILFTESDQASGDKGWVLGAFTKVFELYSVDDAGSFQNIAFSITRGASGAFTDITINPTLTTPNISAAEIGFKGLPVGATTGGAIALTDCGKTLIISSNLTIPTDASVAFPVGTVIRVVNNTTGTLTVAAVTPGTTTLRWTGTSGTDGTRTLASHQGACTIEKIAANFWIIQGDLS